MSQNGNPASFPSSGADSFSTNDAVLGWLQEIAPYGIFTTDIDLRVRSWNHWLVGHSGRSEAQVVGRPLLELFPDLQSRRLSERFTRALSGEVSLLSTALHKYLLPFSLHQRESERRFMLQTARIAPLRINHTVVGTITIIEDVTQREEQALILQRQQELDRLVSSALGALLQSQDPARAVAEIFPTITPSLGLDACLSYLLSDDGKCFRLNSAAGISPKQREALAVLPVDAGDQIGGAGGSAPISRTIGSHEQLLQSLGLRARASFPLAIGERVIGFISVGSYERETIPPGDVAILSRIARYIAIALDRALSERAVLAASRAKDDFLAALSHELRTPLNPVLLLASESVANPDYPPAAREAFRTIEKNALLEARLIDDLLDLTQIEHGKIGLETRPFDVHTAVLDALVMVRPEAEKRGLLLTVDLGGAPSTVVGDTGRLQQVFWNVLKNAVKFTPKGGRIFVTSCLNAEASEIAIQVADTGIGMESHEVTRVFNAFSQGDHAEHGRGHRFGGLGLGLAISRKLVELHAGRIEASSGGKNRGSIFIVRLPLAVSSPGAPAISGASADGKVPEVTPRESESAANSARILLVEDHEPTRVPLARLLARRGHRVVAVPTVAAALWEASQARFDLVLSDIGLPDGDGYALMKDLRDNYGMKGIALTGYGMNEDVTRSTAAGFVAHLTKPISVTVLDRTLTAALQSNIRTNI